jgi:outer membrane protein TolC
MQHNPGLRAALVRLQSARLSVQSEQARFDPVLVLDSGVTRTETPFLVRPESTRTSQSTNAELGVGARKHLVWGTDLQLRLSGSWQLSESPQTFGMIPAGELGPGYGLAARLTLMQPLLRGAGRDVAEAELAAARVRRSSAEHERDRVASELLRDVLSAYWELWFAHATLEIQRQSQALAVRQRDEAKARVRTGSLAPADALAFETSVATRAEELLEAEVALEQRKLELLQRLGVGESRPELGDPGEQTPPTPAAPPSDAEREAIAESALLRARAAEVELARVQARTADDPLRSRLDLEAYVQAQGLGNQDVGAAAEQFGTLGAVSAHVGLVYEAPFSDTRRSAEAARARLAVDAAEAELAEARAGVLAELRSALARQRAGAEKVALAAETARIAGAQLAAEEARFRTGSATPLAVVEAETDLRSAQLRVARAHADVLIASLTVEHLTGRLLQSRARSRLAGRGE